MDFATESISLHLPDAKIKANISYFIRNPWVLSLDLDAVLSLETFQNIKAQNLEHLAVLSAKSESFSEFQCFSVTVNHLITTKKVISATSLDYLGSIFLFFPTTLETQISLQVIRLEVLISSSLGHYMNYLQCVKDSKQELTVVYRKFKEIRKSTENECKELVEKCEKVNKNIEVVLESIREKKEIVIKKAKEYENERGGSAALECSHCKGNMKNILFLPCAHVELCNKCLISDFKITSNLPILNSHLRCTRCMNKVTQALLITN